jgi:eukaryotic-like serine/threonine-protein kinase
MIELGQHLDLGARGLWKVADQLGEGGQGAVWRLDPADGDAESLALKWYFPRSSTAEQREAIRKLVARGSPGPAFLWPLQLVEADDGTFGYVMAVRPPHYRSVSDLLLGRIASPPSITMRVSLELAHAFLSLHAEGLCYRDISFGNVFIEPQSGRVMICDNDNVGVDGDSYTAVLGTRKFMAPEVVRGDAFPSAQTDLHSLAVLIFYLLVVHHPLLGAREQAFRGREGETHLLGTSPLFIFDPADESNRPDPMTQPAPLARWELVPDALRALFLSTFTAGLTDPDRRTRESVWRATLARLRDRIVVCHYCREENLTADGSMKRCRWCRREARRPIQLTGGGETLNLNADTVISRHHVYRDYDLATQIGLVVFDHDRNRWGVRNTGAEPWTCVTPSGEAVTLGTGQTIALVPDLTLRIGPRDFIIDGGAPTA